VLVALMRIDEARRAYETAITANPALEDADLKRAVNTTIRVFGREGQPTLKVVANDDTDSADVLRLLAPAADKVTFKDVGGLRAVKQVIHRKIILPFQKPSLFQRFKKHAGGGILFYGPPGCGKTLLARATAGEVDAAFYSVSIADVLDMYIGESERKLHAIFEKARASILELLLAERPTASDIDVRTLAERTSGFSGADLRELVETGVDEAIEESLGAGQPVPLKMAHLKVALAERHATTVEWLTTARNYARYSNESGQYDEVLEFLDKHGKR
jgi:SpoVK/Ycf46/Vps4 family AAA+-type ATPase